MLFKLLLSCVSVFVSYLANFFGSIGTQSCEQLYPSTISEETTRISNVHISNPVIFTLTVGTSVGRFSVSFKHGLLGAYLSSSLTRFQKSLIMGRFVFFIVTVRYEYQRLVAVSL